MMNKFTGIDVGSQGGIVTLNDNAEIIHMQRVPKIKGDTDRKELQKVLMSLEGFAAIEDVHSLYGMSAKSNFSFGYIKGFKAGAIEKAELFFVGAKERQKTLWIDDDIVFEEDKKGNPTKKKNTKATSLNCANRIFGVEDNYRLATKRSSVPHDGIVDSALIAYWLYLQKYERTLEEILS